MSYRPFLLMPLFATVAIACGNAGSDSNDDSSDVGALESNSSMPEARGCSLESIQPCEPQDSATRQRILGTVIAGLQKELRDQDFTLSTGEPRLSFAKETTNGGGSFLIARAAVDASAPTYAYAVLYGKLMKANGTDELPVNGQYGSWFKAVVQVALDPTKEDRLLELAIGETVETSLCWAAQLSSLRIPTTLLDGPNPCSQSEPSRGGAP